METEHMKMATQNLTATTLEAPPATSKISRLVTKLSGKPRMAWSETINYQPGLYPRWVTPDRFTHLDVGGLARLEQDLPEECERARVEYYDKYVPGAVRVSPMPNGDRLIVEGKVSSFPPAFVRSIRTVIQTLPHRNMVYVRVVARDGGAK
jgi:hypothetical protein